MIRRRERHAAAAAYFNTAVSDVKLIVEFPVHSSADRIASLASGIAAYGNVREGTSPLELHVTVFRPSNLPRLKDQLTRWENYMEPVRLAFCELAPRALAAS